MANINNRTYKAKGKYFNGQTKIENKILNYTGASQCYCIPLPIPVISATKYNFVTYDGRRSTLNQKSKIMMKTPTSFLLECDCYIDHSINNEFYDILLGMNFLDQFTTYDIKSTQITLVDKQNTIILNRIRRNFAFLCLHILM